MFIFFQSLMPSPFILKVTKYMLSSWTIKISIPTIIGQGQRVHIYVLCCRFEIFMNKFELFIIRVTINEHWRLLIEWVDREYDYHNEYHNPGIHSTLWCFINMISFCCFNLWFLYNTNIDSVIYVVSDLIE